MKLPIIKKPCNNCPFRTDCLSGWLGKERAEEIAEAESFICHKTTHGRGEAKQCAGFMLMRKERSLAVRFAITLQIDLELTGEDLVFKNENEFIKHHMTL